MNAIEGLGKFIHVENHFAAVGWVCHPKRK